MTQGGSKLGGTRRLLVYIAIVASVVWIVADTVVDIWAFFDRNRGIEFYRGHPELIGLCLVLSVGLCLAVRVIARQFQAGRRSELKSKEPERDSRQSYSCEWLIETITPWGERRQTG